jgi:hypothetical protein
MTKSKEHKMGGRMSGTFIRAVVFTGISALAQAASAGVVILNHDEWTLSNYGFAQAPASTTQFVGNLAAALNTNGGACNLLVYSSNFGLTGSSLNAALNGAGCSVTYSAGTFDLPTLSAYDGVLLADDQYNYNASTLASFVNAGGNVYIAAGTGHDNEDTMWDSFTHQFGLDFGPSYNGIRGLLPISSTSPLFAGVTELYFNNGNSVSLWDDDPEAQLIVSLGDQGLFGDYTPSRINPSSTVPEPGTLALLAFGFGVVAFRRRKAG